MTNLTNKIWRWAHPQNGHLQKYESKCGEAGHNNMFGTLPILKKICKRSNITNVVCEMTNAKRGTSDKNKGVRVKNKTKKKPLGPRGQHTTALLQLYVITRHSDARVTAASIVLVYFQHLPPSPLLGLASSRKRQSCSKVSMSS